MSETRYPAWWAKLQEDMAASGCFEEGAADRFSIVMHPDDKTEWIEGIHLFRVITLTPAETEAALNNRGAIGTCRIGGIPVFVTPHAVLGRPTVVPL